VYSCANQARKKVAKPKLAPFALRVYPASWVEIFREHKESDDQTLPIAWVAGISDCGSLFAKSSERENRLRIVTASDDHTARVWRILPDTQSLIEYARATVLRQLTPEGAGASSSIQVAHSAGGLRTRTKPGAERGLPPHI
jgi:hypothetical protein